MLATEVILSEKKLCRYHEGGLFAENGKNIFTLRQLTKYSVDVREFIKITKALADPNRVCILLALRKGELCVCQIVELSHLAPSTISKHLSILFHAGLVESRKEGRWIYYKLPGKEAPVVVREAVDWIKKSLNGDARVVADQKALERILEQDPAELCKRQCEK